MLADWINKENVNPEKFKNNFKKNKPFSHIQISNFLKRDKAIKILNSLLKEQFFPKESDLFRFLQTNDLNNTKNKTLQEFKEFLYSKEFINYMQELTGFKLKNKGDLFGTIYQNTCYLLCHDDELEGRKIAYLLYLSNMKEGEGGSLNLASSDKKGNPQKIVKKITPKFNTFTFFEVSPISFHEVEEIIKDKQRTAIGGWYYGLWFGVN